MQRTTANIFHDQDYILLRIYDFIQLHNSLMFHFLHELNLPFDRFPSIWLFKLIFLVNFHCNFLISRLVQTDPDSCISALTDLFSNDVIFERRLLGKGHGIV